MRFNPRDAEQALGLLKSVVGPTEAAPGCQDCFVARDALEETHVRYSEAWESDAAFSKHLRSEEFRRVLVAIDLCREKPQVLIGGLSGRRGMAYLQELVTKQGRGDGG